MVLGSERRRAASCESRRQWVSNKEQKEEKYGTYGYFTSRRKATKGFFDDREAATVEHNNNSLSSNPMRSKINLTMSL
jgi:hypothetical protein